MISKHFVIFSLVLILIFSSQVVAEEGITAESIRLGSVLALKGKAKGLGNGMKNGLEAALKGQKVQNKTIQIIFENDSYEPANAIKATNKILKQNIFLMIGNVGTPTAVKTLPILKQNNVPAVGFFTGAGILRPGNGGPIVNFRASYIQETAAVISEAVRNGIKTNQICSYVQNDGYGMAGLTGVRQALKKAGASADITDSLRAIIAMEGMNPDRNNKGPVGVYVRNTNNVKDGYTSLKNWEKKSGNSCKLIVTVGAYSNISHFVRNSRKENETWLISGVSFTGADDFLERLNKYKTTERVMMTQVVPLLDSDLPIVKEAKLKLGKNFGFVSLEGYIVGKMTLEILKGIQGDITRESFMAQTKRTKTSLGGLKIDFTRNGYQGSDLIVLSQVTADGYKLVSPDIWK